MSDVRHLVAALRNLEAYLRSTPHPNSPEADYARKVLVALGDAGCQTDLSDEQVLDAAKAAWRAGFIHRAKQRGDPMPETFDFEWGWNECATMPLSGPGFVSKWTTIARAVLAPLDAEEVCNMSSENEWIAWSGGECPVAPGDLVERKYRYAPEYGRSAAPAAEWRWEHNGGEFDIIAYRIVQP